MDRKDFLKTLAIIPWVNMAAGCQAKDGMGTSEEPCKTGTDVEGPFYKANAPVREMIESEGTPLQIEGRLLGNNCQTPIANATIDVWHCNNYGDYDMDGFKGRGQVKTDADGNYRFTTIFPPPYGSRPRHIHFKIRATGYEELTTQLYFEGDPNIANDFARNAEKGRVIALHTENGAKMGTFNIYV